MEESLALFIHNRQELGKIRKGLESGGYIEDADS